MKKKLVGKNAKSGKSVGEKAGKKLKNKVPEKVKKILHVEEDDEDEENDDSERKIDYSGPQHDYRRLPKKGAGRPKGSKTGLGPINVSAEIRKEAALTGKMPMEIMLIAARTGYLPREGRSRRKLEVGEQMEMLKGCINYYHPKVNPVFENDEDNRSAFMQMFAPEKVARLQPQELQLLEALMTKLVTGEAKPLPLIENKGKVVDAEFAEVKPNKGGRPKKSKSYSELVKD